MAEIKLKHYQVRKGRGYWLVTPKMRSFGFDNVRCGKDGPPAWAIAQEWEERWQNARRGMDVSVRKVYPRNTVGYGFERFRQTNEWAQKPVRTREDWERGWRYIDPVFGDLLPSSITFEALDHWYAALARKKGPGESGRAMKTWRALYNVLAAMKLATKGQDPSLAIRKKSVPGRTQTWSEGEAVRFVKGAWRAGYRGLACVVAVAWDTGFSPVDSRSVTPSQIATVGDAWGFYIDRGKTGEAALGTLTARTRRLVERYIAELGVEVHDAAPIFRTRGYVPTGNGGRPRTSVPYTKDSLVNDFADVRRLVFGTAEKRRLMDMRRSGAVEALAGDATAEGMSAKLANSMDSNKTLWRTYLPVDPATVGAVDVARRKGRQKLRSEQRSDKKLKLANLKS